ncbi:hypothetical protein DL767_004957 [Monosporascus sp. MG133]|nr:hypothetical protein DL767_004957 [Monosporascus sp. MG133]
MEVFATRPEYDPSHLTDGYDWPSLGPARVIDVGGAQGHVATELAKRFDNLDILIQDMDKVVENAGARIPVELRGKAKFMAHDIFAPQPPGARIIIQDTCMPEPGVVAWWKEKYLRAEDLNMGAIFNSHERTVDEWGALLASADSRFSLQRVIEPKLSALGIIEVM